MSGDGLGVSVGVQVTDGVHDAFQDEAHDFSAFKREFIDLFPEEWTQSGHAQWLEQVYEFAEDAFGDQTRDSEKYSDGTPVRTFDHSVAVARIFLVECRDELLALPTGVSVGLVGAALLHDVGEDTAAFKDLVIALIDDTVHRRTVLEVGVQALAADGPWDNEGVAFLAQVLNGVMKPTNEEITGMTATSKDHPNWIATKNAFQELFIKLAGPAAVAIKAADKISNMRTLDGLGEKRIRKMLDETSAHSVSMIREYTTEEKGGAFTPLIGKLLSLLDAILEAEYAKLDHQAH